MLEEYIHAFTHLRVAHTNGGAPHKPILLLSVMEGVEKGYITSPRIYITAELIVLFRKNWEIWVHTQHRMNFALPFFHLQSEPFWRIVAKAGMEIPVTAKHSIKSFPALVQSVDYAEVDVALFHSMCRPEQREILRNILTQRYFGTTQPRLYTSIDYMDQVADEILKESASQYRRKINHLRQNESEESFEEEVYIRNGVFKKTIPAIYHHTCCISGMRVQTTLGRSLIEACHIVPFSARHDDTITNGIALCPNLHRAFDRGLITISEDYRVTVSPQFIESDSAYSIRQFDRQPLLLPAEKKFYPNQ